MKKANFCLLITTLLLPTWLNVAFGQTRSKADSCTLYYSNKTTQTVKFYKKSAIHTTRVISGLEKSLEPFVSDLSSESNVWLQVRKWKGQWILYLGAESSKSQCFVLKQDSLVYYDDNEGAVSLPFFRKNDKVLTVNKDWWFQKIIFEVYENKVHRVIRTDDLGRKPVEDVFMMPLQEALKLPIIVNSSVNLDGFPLMPDYWELPLKDCVLKQYF